MVTEMNKLNYFVLDIGKIIVIWKKKKMNLYKDVNNQLVLLTEEEEKYVNNIFNYGYNYDFNSEYLTKIINENHNILEKDRFNSLLTWLENIVPNNAKINFYKNLQALKVEYVNKEISNNTTASYNARDNKITIYNIKMEKVYEKSKTTSNPNNYYLRSVNQTLLHELCHVASTKYDKDSNIVLCGFTKYPTYLESEKNNGLTEGMTEVISMYGIPNTDEINSGYYIEASIINLLISIIGNKKLIESYFLNKGTVELEEEFDKLGIDSNISWCLFRNIEVNFCLRDQSIEQSFLGNIQSTLVDYLNAKLKDDKISKEEKAESIFLFKQFIITPEKLKVMKKNTGNYIDLQESIDKFNSLVTQYKKGNTSISR